MKFYIDGYDSHENIVISFTLYEDKLDAIRKIMDPAPEDPNLAFGMYPMTSIQAEAFGELIGMDMDVDEIHYSIGSVERD